MSKEYLEAFRDILGILSAVSGCEVDMNSERIITVKSALQRLESIDNANPSEALGIVDKMANYILLDEEYGFIDDKEKQSIIKDRDIIKQALLKSQEPKHYLKWEDLEFNAKEQRMNVSLNGHPHLLCYYRNMFGSLCMIDNTGITIWEDNKNFFNDLHLERVEE